MFLEDFSPWLALNHEGHHGPEGKGRDGKGGAEGRKDHGEGRTKVDEGREQCHTSFVGHSAAEVKKGLIAVIPQRKQTAKAMQRVC